MDEGRHWLFVRSGTLATVQTVRGIGNSVVPGKMTSVASERGLDIMRTKFSVIADRKWDPIGAGPSENYAQFETKQVVRLSHENRFAFSPSILPNPRRSPDETSSGGKYRLFSLPAAHAI